MTFASPRLARETPLNTPPDTDLRAEIRRRLTDCRAQTLALIDGLDERDLRRQPDPAFSPLGWHLGHIAFVEYVWLLHQLGGAPAPDADISRLYAADGLPKKRRGAQLPGRAELLDFVHGIRQRLLAYLDETTVEPPARLWRWIVQHEAMHLESMRFLAILATPSALPPRLVPASGVGAMIDVEAGPFRQGSDHPDAFDNEGPAHRSATGAYRIARRPVTQSDYGLFMEAGGYDTPDFWSKPGWTWRQKAGLRMPLYWRDGHDDQAVCGVSWYEADAYCRFAGTRLPTEAEWEKAAGRIHMSGHVWEWTASDFAPYVGFRPWPYEGYSTPYFDGAHKVLKGGSWATPALLHRASLRNWYGADTRQIYAGLRCADDGPAL